MYPTVLESRERDLVNFPRRENPENPAPTRLVIFPETWFKFMHSKMGVSGRLSDISRTGEYYYETITCVIHFRSVHAGAGIHITVSSKRISDRRRARMGTPSGLVHVVVYFHENAVGQHSVLRHEFRV